MGHLTLLQMVADDGSSAPVNDATEALNLLAGQALELESARQRIAELEQENAELRRMVFAQGHTVEQLE